MGHRDIQGPQFNIALEIFLRPPQTKLIRHLCKCQGSDSSYLATNSWAIEEVMFTVMRLQGIVPEEALKGSSIIELICAAGRRLQLQGGDAWWELLASYDVTASTTEGIAMKQRKAKSKNKESKSEVVWIPNAEAEAPSLPRTYDLIPVESNAMEAAGVVRMTGREIFENNCPGETPELYDGLDEDEIHAKMFDQADRLAVFADKWHPDDVVKIANACTAFIVESREMKKLDTAHFKKDKQPVTTVPRGK